MGRPCDRRMAEVFGAMATTGTEIEVASSGAKKSTKKLSSTKSSSVKRFQKAATQLGSWSLSALKMGGNLSWAVGTSVMILVMPVVLDIMRDQQLTDHMIQQDAIEQFQRQQSATVVGGAPPPTMNIPGMPPPPPMTSSAR